MEKADWAFVISILSALLALANFAWNIWSKFIFPKPRVRVHALVMDIYHDGNKAGIPFVHFSVTNHGPGEVTITNAIVHLTEKRSGSPIGMLNPLNNLYDRDEPTGPYGGGLPKRLTVGEEFSLNFPFGSDMWLKEPINLVGVLDSFSRFTGHHDGMRRS